MMYVLFCGMVFCTVLHFQEILMHKFHVMLVYDFFAVFLMLLIIVLSISFQMLTVAFHWISCLVRKKSVPKKSLLLKILCNAVIPDWLCGRLCWLWLDIVHTELESSQLMLWTLLLMGHSGWRRSVLCNVPVKSCSCRQLPRCKCWELSDNFAF